VITIIAITEEQKNQISQLIQSMTIDEKIGQMNQAAVSIVGGFEVPFEELIEMLTDGRISHAEFEKIMSTAEQDYHEDEIRAGKVGSLMLQDAKKANELQKIAVEESRLGIPLIIGLDVIHGFRTVFPIALAEACSFDDELFVKTARMAAKESRKQGVNWHFAPMIDVSRDARWGRVSEGPGEDPYLVSQFAKAKIQGLQGDQSSTENYVAACLKHFVAYGAAEGGKDYNTTSMADSLLHNVYLAPFKTAIEEGAATVMAAFNDLNGVPCTVNQDMLRAVLKEEYGFKGFVVSDANGVRECVTHGIAEDEKAAARQAATAGLDMDMGTGLYSAHLKTLIEEKLVDESLLDEAVTRILTIKMWLGLFAEPYVEIEEEAEVPQNNTQLALEAAEKAIVLLKNENNLLPLDRTAKISVIGELADMATEVVGAWSISWKAEDCVSVLSGLSAHGERVKYFATGGLTSPLDENKLKEALAYGDVIVAVVGETVSMSGEAASRATITLPGSQKRMLEKVKEAGKPVVAVLMNGRPLALEWEHQNIDAILETWHLGVQMGTAVANVIFGSANPSGKLSVSFPRVTGQCPIYYNHPNTGRPGGKSKFTSKYMDIENGPLYPFGFGLSYTEYTYSNLVLESFTDSIRVSADVQNTGQRPGTEIVQLYVRDIVGSIVRPVLEMKDYQKVTLLPGEVRTVSFDLPKQKLGFYDNKGDFKFEDGEFLICLGKSSQEYLEEKIALTFD